MMPTSTSSLDLRQLNLTHPFGLRFITFAAIYYSSGPTPPVHRSTFHINTKTVIAVSRTQVPTNNPAEHPTAPCTSSPSSAALSQLWPSQVLSSTAQELAVQQRSRYRQPATSQTLCHTRAAILPPRRMATSRFPPSLPTTRYTNLTLTSQRPWKSSGSSAVSSATATAMSVNARV